MNSLSIFRSKVKNGFTVLELIVTMAIITILATTTITSFSTMARSGRLAGGKNAVIVALERARTIAMQENKVILLIFRPTWDANHPSRPQHTEAIIAEWSGYSDVLLLPDQFVVDRFVPVHGMRPVVLPDGIKVAAPWYDYSNQDDIWATQSEINEMRVRSETPGRLVGVVFDSTGSMRADNPQTDSTVMYVDFDEDGIQDLAFNDPFFPDQFNYWIPDHPLDEVNIEVAPFLAVYDDQEAREFKFGDWSVQNIYINELCSQNGYITQHADRLHFNRYTGDVMK